ncbi:MAG: protease modulator HflC [Planctomycetes bacterium]|nr:protease modulator HflC [Planctomycetota bacterium]
MKKHIGIITLGTLVVGVLLLYTVTYQVDELKDIVLIERFGEVVRELSGAKDAGLKIKWPWPIEKMIRYDSRAFIFEDTHEEVPTVDKQNLLVTVYCAWKIADPAKFHRAVRSSDPAEKIEKTQERIRDLVRSKKKDVVGNHEMASFINTDPLKMRSREIEQQMRDAISEVAMRDYGVAIVGLGIKSLGLPNEVTKAVIDAMKKERQRDVSRYESGGEAMAEFIESRAEAASNQILAFAQLKAKDIRTEGDQAAAKYYRRFRTDPQFAIFLRRRESLKKALSGKTVIMLDGRELSAIKLLREKPSLTPKTSEKAAP